MSFLIRIPQWPSPTSQSESQSLQRFSKPYDLSSYYFFDNVNSCLLLAPPPFPTVPVAQVPCCFSYSLGIFLHFYMLLVLPGAFPSVVHSPSPSSYRLLFRSTFSLILRFNPIILTHHQVSALIFFFYFGLYAWHSFITFCLSLRVEFEIHEDSFFYCFHSLLYYQAKDRHAPCTSRHSTNNLLN